GVSGARRDEADIGERFLEPRDLEHEVVADDERAAADHLAREATDDEELVRRQAVRPEDDETSGERDVLGADDHALVVSGKRTHPLRPTLQRATVFHWLVSARVRQLRRPFLARDRA